MFHTSARFTYLFDRFGPWAARRDPWRPAGTTDREVVTRRATPADERELLRLAGLDSARPLDGDVLVALVDGELWAAIDLADGRVVADPFRPSREAADLLRLRRAHLRGDGGLATGPWRALRVRRASA